MVHICWVDGIVSTRTSRTVVGDCSATSAVTLLHPPSWPITPMTEPSLSVQTWRGYCSGSAAASIFSAGTATPPLGGGSPTATPGSVEVVVGAGEDEMLSCGSPDPLPASTDDWGFAHAATSRNRTPAPTAVPRLLM